MTLMELFVKSFVKGLGKSSGVVVVAGAATTAFIWVFGTDKNKRTMSTNTDVQLHELSEENLSETQTKTNTRNPNKKRKINKEVETFEMSDVCNIDKKVVEDEEKFKKLLKSIG